jgi:hypothetical protein
MAYVVLEDIIASIDNTTNITQGESYTYDITLHRDFIGNQLNARNVSVISVAILNKQFRKVLMYNSPVVPGVSDILNFKDPSLNQPGVISFEINEMQSMSLDSGDLLIQITLIFSDFFPKSKTYIMPTFNIGQVIAGDNNGGGGENPEPPAVPVSSIGTPVFNIQYTDLSLPTTYGKMSINSQIPSDVTHMIFRNLDKNLVRATQLENFLVNRMDSDGIEGILTLYSTKNSKFFVIYKIIEWERVDITSGSGNQDATDGIKIKVALEDIASGPGVSKTLWQIGDEVTYSIDTHGITGTDIKPDGMLTYFDKNKVVDLYTNGPKSPTGIFITYSPYYDSYVMVEVNGISVDVGNASTGCSAYFSGNNGLSAVSMSDVRSGDQLIWNGDVAGFELAPGDEISLIYESNVDDLR